VTGGLPVPSGQTLAQIALGKRIFRGAKGGTCAGCHGANAKGTPLGPNLTDGKWIWGDGSVTSISEIIAKGVPNPKDYRSGMPPMGGAQLMPTDVDRRLGARRLCLGAQPKGRQLKIGLERSRVLARSATDRRKPEPFAAIPARLMRIGLPIFEVARRAIKKREL